VFSCKVFILIWQAHYIPFTIFDGNMLMLRSLNMRPPLNTANDLYPGSVLLISHCIETMFRVLVLLGFVASTWAMAYPNGKTWKNNLYIANSFTTVFVCVKIILIFSIWSSYLWRQLTIWYILHQFGSLLLHKKNLKSQSD
jgi:hypothetical protein